ncbi:hypothetical protein Leryth_001352 [Lithospermum erythrorhizon]|nr:hypothetical protein Leryth_001352 [Lithospermum erythrorhizon]
MDSSSISNNGSGADVAEDEVVVELAKEAALLFGDRKFVECNKMLNQLLQKKGGDSKILHNIAITESFQDGCPDPKKLLDVLSNIKNRIEELAHASVEHVEGNNNIDSKVAAHNGESIVASHQFSPTNSSTIVYTGEYDMSVAMFNMAVIWFHLHEHARSFSILDVLFQNIIPIDEAIALRICILLLDVALLSRHASRCLDVINYMERVFIANNLTNQVNNVNNSSQQPATVTKSAALASNLAVNDVSNSDSVNSLERSLSSSLSDEALEDEPMTLLSSLDISGQRLTKSCGLQSSGEPDESVSSVELRLKWHLYKVQFLLLTRNVKAAKREVKMAMNMVRGNENYYPTALYLKSQHEYTRGNYQKSIKLLMASSDRAEVGISSIYYNNLGCIYFRLGKYHTSSVLFSKALSNSSSLRKEKPLRLSTFSRDKSQLIVYNCGVQHMACGKPLIAARCFHKASRIFYDRPLLWLRVAECCLMALEKGLLKSSSSSSSDKYDMEVYVIGKGTWRELVLKSGPSEDGHVRHLAKECSFLGDDGQPCLSMSLAQCCLLNALYLLDSSDSGYSKSGLSSNLVPEDIEQKETIPSSKNADLKILPSGDAKTSNLGVVSGLVISNGEAKDQKSGNSQNAYLHNSLSDYKDICRKENQIIRQALLADLAFVELELGNPLKALAAARALLELDCLRIYSFAGNMYAAEALCLLNRPMEAAEHLSLYVSSGNTVDPPYRQEDCEKWRVDNIVDFEESTGGPTDTNSTLPDETQGFVFLKPEEARGTLYANLAAMSALQGDFEQANQFVIQALSIMPNSPDAICTAIYVGSWESTVLQQRSAN